MDQSVGAQRGIFGFVEQIAAEGICGWALDLDASDHPLLLQLSIDGEPAGLAACDGHRPDVKNRGFPADRAGFRFLMPRLFQDGKAHSLEFHNVAGEPVQLSAADGVPLRSWEFTLPVVARTAASLDADAVGFLESITDERINGWAVNLKAIEKSLLLRVYVDDEPIAAVACSLLRPDVKARGFPTERAGFSFAVPQISRDGKQHAFAFRTASGAPVRLRRLGGEEREVWDLSFPPAPVNNELRGHVEAITHAGLKGWIFDPATPDRPVVLHLAVDGEPVASAGCDEPREDVQAAGIPRTDVGYTLAIPRQFLDGEPHSAALSLADGQLVGLLNSAGQRRASWSFTLEPIELLGRVDGFHDANITGWVLVVDHRNGTQDVRNQLVIVNHGQPVAQITADLFRPDVAAAIACDPHCGFSFIPPAEFCSGQTVEFRFIVLPYGRELPGSPLSVTLPSRDDEAKLERLLGKTDFLLAQLWEMRQQLKAMMSAAAYNLENYEAWAEHYFARLRRRCGAAAENARLHAGRGAPIDAAARRLLVSVICPVYRPRLEDFEGAVASVRAQTHQNWELIIVDDASGSAELAERIRQLGQVEPRIKPIFGKRNGGISAASNLGLRASTGDYVAFLDHDDVLVEAALELMTDAAARTGAKVLYSDEDKIDADGRLCEPHLKPDWNYRLLLSFNYVCHLLMVERAHLRKLRGLRSAYDGAQDFDLVLRLAEITEPAQFAHVAEVLYHWRRSGGSTAAASANKAYAVEAGRRAIADHLARRGLPAEVRPKPEISWYDVSWRFTAEPEVTLIIPYREHIAMTRACVEAILDRTAYGNYRIILVDNWSTSPESFTFAEELRVEPRVTILRVPEKFNFSRLNNLAVKEAASEYVLFMNNDVTIRDLLWLRRMVDEALADERVAIVGIKLLYPDGTVQHAGTVLGAGGVGDHAHRGLAGDDPGYFGRAVCAQDLSAVTAACMLCRRKAFTAVGGFDERELAVAFNDVDLCLKIRAAGYRIVWTAATGALHAESWSRGSDFRPEHQVRFFQEHQTMIERWGPVLARDPFYNPHFSRDRGTYRDLATRAPADGDDG
jgi:GT2 family glycosyltransferase